MGFRHSGFFSRFLDFRIVLTRPAVLHVLSVVLVSSYKSGSFSSVLTVRLGYHK